MKIAYHTVMSLLLFFITLISSESTSYLNWHKPDNQLTAESSETSPKVQFIEVNIQSGANALNISLAYSFGEPVKLTLYDVVGRSVYKEVMTSPRFKIDISGFARGVYYLQAVMGENRHCTQKVVIE